MNEYEKLSSKEADLLWDRERFDHMPEQERELVSDEINRTLESETGDPEPCDLYDRCWECPNFEDCVGVPSIPNEIGAKL
jgi:hypothetical protein